MLTIVTVHGTFAGQETSPKKWWQTGSDFHDSIGQKLVDPDKQIDVLPHRWSGENSETDRRHAGRQLYARLLDLEQEGRNYLLIGHSHGGSVIEHALLEASRRKNPLKNLTKWITVGTPFVQTQPKKNLFSRLGTGWRAIYSALLVASLAVALTIFMVGVSDNNVAPLASSFLALVLFSPVLIVFWITKFFQSRSDWRHRKSVRVFAAANFSSRSRVATHPDDEAVGLLSSVQAIRPEIFKRGFMTTPLSVLSFLLIPVFMFTFAGHDQWMLNLVKSIASTDQLAYGNLIRNAGIEKVDGVLKSTDPAKIWHRVALIGIWIWSGMTETIVELFNFDDTGLGTGFFAILFAALFAIMIIGMLVVCLVSTLNYLVAVWLSNLLGSAISGMLNQTTWLEARQRALGNDVTSEVASTALRLPSWMPEAAPVEMPPVIYEDISRAANEAANQAISRLRRTAFDAEVLNTSSFLEQLTWRELIHNQYFDRPIFRSWMAVEVAASCQKQT